MGTGELLGVVMVDMNTDVVFIQRSERKIGEQENSGIRYAFNTT
jgi:hypothetical protein